ncbi:hypothetical protein A3D77_03205 [Candidatus Gottesmanbacteria bacterium RIFCSPHIGHO2_02_FULL_39_11]|uniref:DUF4325 domain-containing protein n=1 Tax=Candidatus Gottesmanbacteria bacterium RIFCSPHIGHO2_02_FULL_39_11 TaxID=1798382 RepID=A0A1F5ZUH0_9BACT|nr:MAG: hypothetical protein A3D77_03205 [Candidatus Gottesmanbacteria bacterium RIFCSPHIGHO2_02_FULL_39_11]
MTIQISKYGSLLVSRPAGHDAYLSAKAYLLNDSLDKIELDFSGVEVMTPSWLDEFLTPLKKEYGNKVELKFIENPTVQASLATISASEGK